MTKSCDEDGIIVNALYLPGSGHVCLNTYCAYDIKLLRVYFTGSDVSSPLLMLPVMGRGPQGGTAPGLCLPPHLLGWRVSEEKVVALGT